MQIIKINVNEENNCEFTLGILIYKIYRVRASLKELLQ